MAPTTCPVTSRKIALRRRARSAAHSAGRLEPPSHRQARMPIGQRERHRHLTVVLLAEADPSTNAPPRPSAAPALGKPVSSMIQASTDPCRSIAGNTISRTLPKTRSSDQPPSPTKCNSDCAVMPPCAPAPSQPPSAPRSCVRTAALAPCNSRAADQPDPCGRSRSQDLRHRTQTAIHSQWRRREPLSPLMLLSDLGK